MRLIPNSSSCCVLLLAAVVACAAAVPTPEIATAEEPHGPSSGGASCTCPDDKAKLWPRRQYADLKPSFDATDEIAALESVQIALSEIGDGASYVWHRRNGRLSGVVQPTSSFRTAAGRVCRHILVMLSSGDRTRRTEVVACRLADGRWQLDG